MKREDLNPELSDSKILLLPTKLCDISAALITDARM